MPISRAICFDRTEKRSCVQQKRPLATVYLPAFATGESCIGSVQRFGYRCIQR